MSGQELVVVLGLAPLFEDRSDAGRRLAAEVLRFGAADDPVVVGLARGGVVVAAEVARELGAELDVVAVRKIGHPWQPEYAIGAVAAGQGAYLRGGFGLTRQQRENAGALARERAEELDHRLHRGRPPSRLEGRTCILVDDGLATGATMVAAIQWARAAGAARVVAAVPVAAAESVLAIRRAADAFICLHELHDFGAVGPWYRDFDPVTEEDLGRLLAAR